MTSDTKDTKQSKKPPAKGGKAVSKKSTAQKKERPAPKGEHACTPELANKILTNIENNGVSFSEACKKANCNRPNAWHFIHTDKELDNRYVRAREARGVMFGEKVSKVADDTLAGKYGADVARVAIDAYKWTAARMASNHFGDKIDHTHGGPNGGAIPHQMTVLSPALMASFTEEELKAFLKLHEVMDASKTSNPPGDEQ